MASCLPQQRGLAKVERSSPLAASARAVRTMGHFPTDDVATKLIYLVLNHAAADWKRAPREWNEARVQFAVIFSERFIGQ